MPAIPSPRVATSAAVLALGLGALGLLSGCGGGDGKKKQQGVITPTQARAIRFGVTKAQVRARLGPPFQLGNETSPRRGGSCWYYLLALPSNAIDPNTVVEYRYCFRRDRVALYSTAEFTRTEIPGSPRNPPLGTGG